MNVNFPCMAQELPRPFRSPKHSAKRHQRPRLVSLGLLLQRQLFQKHQNPTKWSRALNLLMISLKYLWIRRLTNVCLPSFLQLHIRMYLSHSSQGIIRPTSLTANQLSNSITDRLSADASLYLKRVSIHF